MMLQRQAAAAVAAADSTNVAAITRRSMLSRPCRNGPEPTWATTAISTPTPTSTRAVRRSHLDDRTARTRGALVDADITATPGDRCARRRRRAHRGAIATNAARGTPHRRPRRSARCSSAASNHPSNHWLEEARIVIAEPPEGGGRSNVPAGLEEQALREGDAGGPHEPAPAHTTLLVCVERGREDVVARVPGVEADLAGHAQAQQHGASDGDAGTDDGAQLLRGQHIEQRGSGHERGAVEVVGIEVRELPGARADRDRSSVHDRAGRRRSSHARRGSRSSRAGPRSADRAAAAPAIASSSPFRFPGHGSRSDPVRAARLLRGRVRGTGRAHPPAREAPANRC